MNENGSQVKIGLKVYLTKNQKEKIKSRIDKRIKSIDTEKGGKEMRERERRLRYQRKWLEKGNCCDRS